MDRLDRLESISVHILREAYANFRNLCMLWSIGKDSTVLLWLTRKAFLGHVPFPLIHIDTNFKIPEMIEYRDQMTRRWRLNMIYGINHKAIDSGQTFPDGKLDRINCCKALKSETLRATLAGLQPRYRFDHETNTYRQDTTNEPFNGAIVGVRADEEGSRSKERYFSTRDRHGNWDIANQPMEIWNQFKTEFAPGAHIRVHPLLDWTELNIWEYIDREDIPTVSLYYDQGDGQRYRSLGCYPCTKPINSKSRNPAEIVEELKNGNLASVAERSGRQQDSEDGGGLETLRREGYM